MLKKIVVAIAGIAAVLVTGICGIAATRPDTFQVQRTASIQAPPEEVFALIEDFQRWGSWSPYENRDPQMKRTYSGPARGEGAVYEWAGNRNIGKGRMVIEDASRPSHVTISLDFIEPFEAHNTAEFTLEPAGGATRVTWAMHGPNQFIGKVMSVFIDMDDMIGRDFEAGLSRLKSIAEAQEGGRVTIGG